MLIAKPAIPLSIPVREDGQQHLGKGVRWVVGVSARWEDGSDGTGQRKSGSQHAVEVS